jgi:hypothetical protein
LIVVNSNTRQFSIPGADLVFGVMADSGSEIKYFQCPRYVGNNIDLAGSFVRINYRNANGETDSYLVQDVTVDGDNVTFSWELAPKVTAYKGQVKFVLCVVGPDLKVKWHTTLGSGQIHEGLEPEQSHIEDETADVVAALITMVEAQTAKVEAEGATQVQNVRTAAQNAQSDAVAQIEAKGASTLATIPEDYTAVQNAVRGMANAIRGRASGEVIRVDDVSPMEHYPKIRVFGKNQFNVAAISVQSAPSSVSHPYVSEVGDNYFCITTREGYTNNGYCELKKTLRELCPGLEVGKKYRLSAETESSQSVFYLLGTREQWSFGWTKTITEEILDSVVVAYGFHYVNEGKVGTCRISNIQLEEGTAATTYTPYIDPTTVTVTRCGKNLLSLPYYEGQKVERDGITGTVNADGSVHLVGTATANFYFRFGQINLGSATISAGNNNGVYSLQNCTYDSANKFVYHQVFKGETVNKTVYPLVEAGTVKTDYETPYASETIAPAPDGTVSGLTAVSPTMTLLTDTPGVTIDCEYSRDTNKVIAEILEKITALGG